MQRGRDAILSLPWAAAGILALSLGAVFTLRWRWGTVIQNYSGVHSAGIHQAAERLRVCESQYQDYRVAAADIPVKANFWARLPTWASAV